MPKWCYDDEAEEFTGDALYFIQEGEDGPIKIGRGDPDARLRTLQIGNSRPLRIAGAIEHLGYSEALWHRAFECFRIRGEWFQPADQLLTAIGWAVFGENWADDAPPPTGVDAAQFKEAMLDAEDWYRDLVFGGESERLAAAKAYAYACDSAALDRAA